MIPIRFLLIGAFCVVLGFDSKAGSLSGSVELTDGASAPIILQLKRALDTENEALFLDGDGDYLVVDDLTNLSGSEITIQYWFQGSSTQSAVRQQSGGWIVTGWNGLHILSNDGGAGGIDQGPVNDGQWHHSLVTWKQGESNGFASYMDGVLIESRDASEDPIGDLDAPLHIGAFNGAGEFTQGVLDEIVVWDRFMSAEEVAANWYRKPNGDAEGVVGYWNFDDGGADDQSPNGFDAFFEGDADIDEVSITGLDAYYSVTLESPGEFLFEDVPDGDGYELFAFADWNGNGRFDAGEPVADLSETPINIGGAVESVAVDLQIPPSIVESPEDVRVVAGADVTLSVVANGSEPKSYEWRRNGEALSDSGNLSGTSTAELLISDGVGVDSGSYSVRIWNAAGEAVSPGVTVLFIDDAVSISGNILYEGSQAGPIRVTAAQKIENNKVLNLEGDDAYAITTLTDLSGGEGLTIQYWFRGNSIQSAVRQQATGFIVAGWNGTHILSFDGGTSAGLSAGSVADGAWHQVTMTWEPEAVDGFSSYLDGRLVDRRASADVEIPDLQAQVYFGAFNGAGEFTDGRLDEIAIWDRALPEGEIAINWNQPLTGEEDGLFGFWNFDDGFGDDLTREGNHAELINDATIEDESIPGFGGGVFRSVLNEHGAYRIDAITPGRGFEITAFMDVNENGILDATEPSGTFGNDLIDLLESNDAIDLVLREAPRITDQPRSQRAPTGGSATFEIGVAGSDPLDYQWFFDGEAIDGADDAALTLNGVTADDEGRYSVRISNDKGSVVSAGAELAIVDSGVSLSGAIQLLGGLGANERVFVTAEQIAPGNRVLALDGDGDFVEVPELRDLSGSEVSIQYWFRGDSFQSAIRQQSAGWIVTGWNGLHILSNDGGTGGISAGADVTDGSWHQLTVTWENGEDQGFRSYLDGVLVESRDASFEDIPFHDASLFFGAFNGTGEFTNGRLDEIAIWERVLSDEEITQGWRLPLVGAEEGLIGLWKFDDGTAIDSSDNAWEGFLNGDAVIVEETISGFGGVSFSDVFVGGGTFSMDHLPTGANYRVSAFVDLNRNDRRDDDEPSVFFDDGGAFDLVEDRSGVSLTLGAPGVDVALAITRDGSSITISWPEDLEDYQLWTASQLVEGEWSRVEGVDGNAVTLIPADAQGYFQLRRQ